MSLQYLTDSYGQTTGVFIPIDEWNELKDKFKGLGENTINISEWQTKETQRRLELIEESQIKTRSWEDAERDIFKK